MVIDKTDAEYAVERLQGINRLHQYRFTFTLAQYDAAAIGTGNTLHLYCVSQQTIQRGCAVFAMANDKAGDVQYFSHAWLPDRCATAAW